MKKIISLLLVLSMLLCVLPAASASEPAFSYSLTLNKSIAINFKTTGFEEGYYVTFTKGDGAEGTHITAANRMDGEKYVFTFTELSPKELNTEITFKVYNAEDQVVSEETRSVLTYCNWVLANSDDAKLKTLVVDLLNYGAAFQTYKNYNTNDLANADVDQANATTTEPSMTYDPVDGTDGAISSVGVLLNDSVELYFVAGENKGVATIEVNGNTITPITDGNFIFDKLDPTQMREPVTVQAYDANGDTVGGTLTYTIEDYAARCQTNNPGITEEEWANLKSLTVAMMKYGDAAAAWVGNSSDEPSEPSKPVTYLYQQDFETAGAEITNAALTTDKAHSGSSSLKLTAASGANAKFRESLGFTFSGNVASIMVYDDLSEGTGLHVFAGFYAKTYKLHGLSVDTGVDPDHYIWRDADNEGATTIARTEGWHEFTYDMSGEDLVMLIDGKLAHTIEGFADDPLICFYICDIWGNNNRDGDLCPLYFDDFAVYEKP